MDLNLLMNIAFFVFLAWFIYSRFAGVKGLKNLTPDQFQEELQKDDDAVLVDVREPHEVRQGYIPGALNIPLSQLKHRMGEIPQDRGVYLYCRSGMRSRQAARILQKNKFRELFQLQGGILSWKGKIIK